MADYPSLLYFTLENRPKGHALIARLCGGKRCGKPLAYVNERGLQLSAKHDKDRIDTERLTPNDLRALADFVESLQANSDTMEPHTERAA